ncbi:MAG TPA: glycosyltransferase, partial [Candidatus Thermoplasmatota archaeon]|nr:glycosyltransferase [Candidatus Thermoplasmatota archaeon]
MTVAISVVVPCRNEAASLRACLDALALQDYPRDRFEVIVVDGGSTDGCADVARARGTRLLADRGEGPAAARNLGIRAAQGGIVAFTDADCMPRPDWLTRVAEVFAEDPGVAGVAGALRMPRETFLGRLEDDEARAHYRGVITSNVSYRRAALLDVGGFDESLQCAEDYDLAWRLVDAGHRVVHDPRPVVVHSPPEVHGSVAGYLRKQLWYAESDVPAHVRAFRRRRGSRDAAGS